MTAAGNVYSNHQYNFDTVLNKTENFLSCVSAIPGVGFVSGALKS